MLYSLNLTVSVSQLTTTIRGILSNIAAIMRLYLQVVTFTCAITFTIAQDGSSANSCILNCEFEFPLSGGISGCIEGPDGKGVTCFCGESSSGKGTEEANAQAAECYLGCVSDAGLDRNEVFRECDEFFDKYLNADDSSDTDEGSPSETSSNPSSESESPGPDEPNTAAARNVPVWLIASILVGYL